MKKVRIPRASKTMVYFGQRTEKDAPFFALSQALNAWGPPPSPGSCNPATARTPEHRHANSPPRPLPLPVFVQGDLFAVA